MGILMMTRARSSDPVTSHLAAQGLQLAESQAVVLRLLREAGQPLADHELVERAMGEGCRLTGQRIRTARSELAGQGLVQVALGVFHKTPAGRRAQTWQAAPAP